AIPSLSFQERDLQYTYLDPSNGATYMLKKAIRPVYLEFPAMFKFRTDRIENWAAYGITGIRFGIDMASDKDVNNLSASTEDQIVKIKKTDFGFEVGGGFDFFLEYFKFGIELKLGAGMMNLHLDENTSFDNPIDFLRSKVWTLSLTFEG
ncbi:MAG: outer membrane beta-barrel protein, partial [Bacteroidota bacterium]|nr:outer membrane beta-barrel protein [Bacteroidota bacterium]